MPRDLGQAQFLEEDFILIPNAFSIPEAREIVSRLFHWGADPLKGFHHPDLRPNRFHSKPKYPVKKFMCLGLYWDPKTYLYRNYRSDTRATCFPIPVDFSLYCQFLIQEFFPELAQSFSIETTMVNFYCQDSAGKKSSMGMHRDKDEEDQWSPVIGWNFGSTARFQYIHEDKPKTVNIPGNSIYLFGRKMRLMPHAVRNIYQDAHPIPELARGERMNLTFRKVYRETLPS